MTIHVTHLWKRTSTMFTNVRFGLFMNWTNMYLKIIFPGERFITHFTFVLLFFQMHSGQMLLQSWGADFVKNKFSQFSQIFFRERNWHNKNWAILQAKNSQIMKSTKTPILHNSHIWGLRPHYVRPSGMGRFPSQCLIQKNWQSTVLYHNFFESDVSWRGGKLQFLLQFQLNSSFMFERTHSIMFGRTYGNMFGRTLFEDCGLKDTLHYVQSTLFGIW